MKNLALIQIRFIKKSGIRIQMQIQKAECPTLVSNKYGTDVKHCLGSKSVFGSGLDPDSIRSVPVDPDRNPDPDPGGQK